MEASELLKSAKLVRHNGKHLIDTDTVLGLLEEFSKNASDAGHRKYDLGWDDATDAAVDMMRMCFRHMAKHGATKTKSILDKLTQESQDMGLYDPPFHNPMIKASDEASEPRGAE
jgi:hypothetical protein